MELLEMLLSGERLKAFLNKKEQKKLQKIVNELGYDNLVINKYVFFIMKQNRNKKGVIINKLAIYSSNNVEEFADEDFVEVKAKKIIKGLSEELNESNRTEEYKEKTIPQNDKNKKWGIFLIVFDKNKSSKNNQEEDGQILDGMICETKKEAKNIYKKWVEEYKETINPKAIFSTEIIKNVNRKMRATIFNLVDNSSEMILMKPLKDVNIDKYLSNSNQKIINK